METSINTGIAAHIAVVDGQPTTTTQDIAEVFGKRHDHVLRVARQRMTEAGAWGVPNFGETSYTNPQNGQTYPVIRLTKKGFVFVVQKFTGAKAVKFQLDYIDEFERMEQALRQQPALPAIDHDRMKLAFRPGDHVIAASRKFRAIASELPEPQYKALLNEADLRELADGYLAWALGGKRWLVSFDDRGQIRQSFVPADAFVFSSDELPSLIRDPGAEFDNQQLVAINNACVERLAAKASAANECSNLLRRQLKMVKEAA